MRVTFLNRVINWSRHSTSWYSNSMYALNDIGQETTQTLRHVSSVSIPPEQELGALSPSHQVIFLFCPILFFSVGASVRPGGRKLGAPAKPPTSSWARPMRMRWGGQGLRTSESMMTTHIREQDVTATEHLSIVDKKMPVIHNSLWQYSRDFFCVNYLHY